MKVISSTEAFTKRQITFMSNKVVSCYVIHGLLLNVENPLATRGRDTSITILRDTTSSLLYEKYKGYKTLKVSGRNVGQNKGTLAISRKSKRCTFSRAQTTTFCHNFATIRGPRQYLGPSLANCNIQGLSTKDEVVNVSAVVEATESQSKNAQEASFEELLC